MTDSSTPDSNKTPKSDDLTVEEGLSELRSLLLGIQMQEGANTPKVQAPDSSNHDISNETEKSDRSQSHDELNELRSLLFGTQVQEKLNTPKADATNSSTRDVSNQTPPNNHSTVEDGLKELRSLLFGLSHSELDQLYPRLKNPNIDADDVSRVLPEAVMLRSMQDKQLGEAMVSTVEEAIQISVKKDLTVISNAIFPVIGPATRKAISTALEATIQSLNQTVEHSLSPQSFKWRLEAAQTGKSFAEVLLLRTLLYRVEQVFLIHKKTGLLLQHVVAPAVAAQDADLVSAMLTAIQSFVQDSFSVQTGDALDTLHFGDLTIWVEQGPQAILAGVIRGHPPQELRLVFQDAIEKIHLKFINELNSFEGDTSTFEASNPYLEACLQAQYKSQQKKNSSYVWGLLGVLAIAMGIWSFFTIRDKLRWAAYLERLHAEHGIVVTTAEQRQGKYFISGLRDPLATDPIKLMQQANLHPDAVTSHWEPYLSLDSEFIAKRAKQLLKPPQTVSLKVDENGILHATGFAPQQWIVETRQLVRAIPGITKFQEDNLIAAELGQLEPSKKQIEKQVLLFAEGTTQLIPGQDKTLLALVGEIKKLSDFAGALDKDVRIQIVGHTDNTGAEQTNMKLSQARGEAILSTLVSLGLKATNLSSVGVGTREPLQNDLTVQDKALNRSVTFKVILTDASNRGTTRP